MKGVLLTENLFLRPSPKVWRWAELLAIFIGILNFAVVPFVIHKDKYKYKAFVEEFVKLPDFIGFMVIEMWGIYIVLAVCGFILMWMLIKFPSLPFMFSSTVSFVYLFLAVRMSFSYISVSSQLAAFANA